MKDSDTIPVYNQDGQMGSIDPTGQSLDGSQSRIWMTLNNGQRLWVPWDILQLREDGSAYIPYNLPQAIPQTGASGQTAEETGYIVLPVVEEELSVRKRPVETGTVRIHKQVSEREEVVDEPGFQEHVHVERVPVNQVLDVPAEVRQEGDTTIIPVMEEVLVVEKRLILKEEVRVTKERQEVRNPQKYTLRSENVDVQRLNGEDRQDAE